MAPGKGLEIFHEYVPGYRLASPESSTLSQTVRDQVDNSSLWGIKLKAPIVIRAKTKVLLDAKYSQQRFQFEDGRPLLNPFHENLGTKSLQSFRLGAIISRSVNETQYWAGRIATSYNGSDFDQIYPSIESTTTSAVFMYGFKKSPVREWGVGVAQTLQFGQYRVYPLLMYNRTFSDSWGLEIVLPKEVYMRHNFSDLMIARAGISLDGNNYNLLSGQGSAQEWVQLRQNFLRLELGLERKLTPMLWMSFQTGYLQPVTWEYAAFDGDAPLRGTMDRSFYTRFSISIRAPR